MNNSQALNRNRCISYPRGQTRGDNQPAAQEANTPSQHHPNQFQDAKIENSADDLEQTPPILNNRGAMQNGASSSQGTNGVHDDRHGQAAPHSGDAITLHDQIRHMRGVVSRNLKQRSLADAIFFAEKVLALNIKRHEQSQTLTQGSLHLHLEAAQSLAQKTQDGSQAQGSDLLSHANQLSPSESLNYYRFYCKNQYDQSVYDLAYCFL